MRTKNIRLLVVCFLVLAGLLITAKILGGVMSLWAPGGIKPERNFSWDGVSSVNLVFVYPNDQGQDSQSVVNYNPQSQTITILDIDNQTYFDLPRGYGSWQVGSIYKLGQDNNPPNGAQLVKVSTSKLLGLPVDGVIVRNDQNQTEQNIQSFHKNNFSILSFLTSSKSDLSPIEQARLYWAMSQVRPDKLISLNFLHSDVTTSKLLPDSSRVLGVNTVSLDIFIRQYLSDDAFTAEGKEVTILNGTQFPGLTQDASRLVTNLGGTVISVGNSSAPQKTSSLIVKKPNAKGSITQKRLAEIFAPNCQKGCQNSDSSVTDSRADIVLVLGEDYYNFWNSQK